MNLLDQEPAAARAALEAWLQAAGAARYRLDQILPRLWQRPVRSWSDATDLPAELRSRLEEAFPLPAPDLAIQQTSSDGTVKFLWRFGDARIESVWIPERQRRTLCISSQEGCAYACQFCATGRMGFARHLDPWEIAAQVREMVLRPEFGKPSNVVFMGMGEPLHNWRRVATALSLLNAPEGLGIGARHITVSTIGIVPGLRALAERPEQFRVALSLHSAISERRRELMPVERKYPLEQVLETLKAFPRRVTFEYVMIRGFNDRPEDLTALTERARALQAHVNLLPLHPGGGTDLLPTPPHDIRQFAKQLRTAGINATVRASRGLDISAACGQLRTDADGEVFPEDDAGIE